MAGESSSNPPAPPPPPPPPNPPASSSSGKTSNKTKKSIDNVLQGVKRVFSMKRKPKAPKADRSEPIPEVAASSSAAPPPPSAPPPSKSAPPPSKSAPLPSSSAPPPSSTPAAGAVPEKAVERLKTPVSRKPRAPPGPPPPVLSPAQRAAELFRRHGIDITPGSLPRADSFRGERVHKEIRMRIHRTCHRCNTSYGADKTCLTCGHRRCKQCPRFPQKKDTKGKEKVGEKREIRPVRRRKGESTLTLPSRTGGQDKIRKNIRQRVHRTCHRCDTDFGAEKVCSKCKHNRCKKCPRDPHKKNKPPGYYDDRDDSDSEAYVPRRPNRTYKPIKMRIHWTCSKCSATFPGTKVCDGCGSLREDTGIRDPPKKQSKNPNDAIPSESYIEHLEERLMATSIA